MQYWRGLEIRMLGTFSMEFEGRPIQLSMKQSAKPVQLLLLLLTAGEAGLSRHAIVEALFDQESESDAASSLNVAVSRLRKILRDSDLPNEKYIHTRIDRYYFECPFPLWVDTHEIESLRQAADVAKSTDRSGLLYKLCDIFGGRFLPDLDGEDWVEMYRAQYQRIFHGTAEELCQMLEAKHSYTELLRLAGFAAQMFPFDEWQVWQQKALLALGRTGEAHALYHQVEKLYLDEFDTPPPKQMFIQLRYGIDPHMEPSDAAGVAAQLRATQQEGNRPAYLPLPSFKTAYRYLLRCSSAGYGNAPVCVLCSLESKGAVSNADLLNAMDVLEDDVVATLTLGGAYTRFSRSQLLLLLADGSHAQEVIAHLNAYYEEAAHASGIALTCDIITAQQDLP